jgi:hypothetical protein
MTSKDLQTNLFPSGIDIDASTVRRRLLEVGWKARKPIKKQLLTRAMKEKWVAWANKYKSWTTYDCKKVAFNDQSHFFLFKVTEQMSDKAVMKQ